MGERDEGATPALTRSQAPPPEQVRRVANTAVPGGCAGHGDAEGAGRALPSGCMWPGGGGGAGLQGAVFISFCCCNKRPQTQRLQHQECWQPKVWRHLIGLRPRSQQSCVPFRKSCRRVRFLALPASGGRPRCSARGPSNFKCHCRSSPVHAASQTTSSASSSTSKDSPGAGQVMQDHLAPSRPAALQPRLHPRA